jgi:hypothetical protein
MKNSSQKHRRLKYHKQVKKNSVSSASYMTSLLSTVIIVLSGITQLTLAIVIACPIITVGAVVAAKDLLLNNAVQKNWGGISRPQRRRSNPRLRYASHTLGQLRLW